MTYSEEYDQPAKETVLPENLSPEELLKIKSNGYALADYQNFFKDWELVTVRYREDTGEMRLTYANDLAMEGLREGKGVYADGAVFAKIGFMSKPDPGFASSLSPLGARRYQLMIKDSKLHSETDGWGYALFNAGGTGGVPRGEFPNPQSCHACHKLVPERGFVFSIPMTLDPHRPMEDLKFLRAQETAPQLEFYTHAKTKLPKRLQDLVKGDWVRLLEGDVAKYSFPGTLQEVPPFLIRDIAQHNLPAALVGGKEGALLIQPDPESSDGKCTATTGKPGMMLVSYRTNTNSPQESPVIQKICSTLEEAQAVP